MKRLFSNHGILTGILALLAAAGTARAQQPNLCTELQPCVGAPLQELVSISDQILNQTGAIAVATDAIAVATDAIALAGANDEWKEKAGPDTDKDGVLDCDEDVRQRFARNGATSPRDLHFTVNVTGNCKVKVSRSATEGGADAGANTFDPGTHSAEVYANVPGGSFIRVECVEGAQPCAYTISSVSWSK